MMMQGSWWDETPPGSETRAGGAPDVGGFESGGFDAGGSSRFGFEAQPSAEQTTYDDSWHTAYDEDDIQTEGLDFAAQPTSLTMLYLAMGAATAGLVIGLVVNFLLGGRPTTAMAAIAFVGWLLAGVVAVLGVASYQSRDLASSAASMFYQPNPSASLLRLAPLVVGAIGVVLTTFYIADWAARL
jgi:hypothetical protein